jgi:hypothetical protein
VATGPTGNEFTLDTLDGCCVDYVGVDQALVYNGRRGQPITGMHQPHRDGPQLSHDVRGQERQF